MFCERLAKVAAAYARRTVRLNETLTLLAFALGARGASRAAAKLNFPAGKDTILRVIRQMSYLPADNIRSQFSALMISLFAKALVTARFWLIWNDDNQLIYCETAQPRRSPNGSKRTRKLRLSVVTVQRFMQKRREPVRRKPSKWQIAGNC